MEDEIETTKKEVIDRLKATFPEITGLYQWGFLEEAIDYLAQISKKPDSLFMQYSYPEYMQVVKLSEARNRIQTELIDGESESYIWRDDNPKNDYEEGLYSAMRYIDVMIHWMAPD